MQYPDDDMDELFRKAAEGYPLNTDGANWDKVSAMLSQDEQRELPPARKHSVWLLLLLPFMLICNRMSEGEFSLKNPASVVDTITARTLENRAGVLDAPQGSTGATRSLEESSIQKNTTTTLISDVPPPTTKSTFRKSELFAEPKTGQALTVDDQHPQRSDSRRESIPLLALANEAKPVQQAAGLEELADTTLASEKIESRGEERTALTEQDQQHQPDTSIQITTPPAAPVRKNRFTVSFVAGPDLTTVRFEKFSNVGFQAGLLIGYRVSHRISVETGVLSVKKFYKSDGEYLNKARLYLPAYTEILAIDGNCRMLELPVTIQYTFSETSKRRWFAAAGFSSYIMKTENYTYDYLYTNTGRVVSHSKTYSNQSRNWFSVLQVSVGHLQRLGKAGSLRVEPYYAVPLNGIGYGELPISSMGVRLGFTPNF